MTTPTTSGNTIETGVEQNPGHILHTLMLFAEVLRKLGLQVGSGNVLDLVKATEYAPVSRKQEFFQAARCLLVHRQQDLALFDEAFEVFWRKPATRQTSLDIQSMGEKRRFRKPQVAPPQEAESGLESENPAPEGDQVFLNPTFSASEVFRGKDFAEYTPGEILEARRMMARLSWDLGRRRTRRLTSGDGQQLDLRKTLRLNLKYGGEPLELAHLQRKDKLRPLVLICDVSGSMERYTRMLLHFIHTISGDVDHAEAFLFATRLTRITRYLNHRGVDQTVDEVSNAVPDWAGGTRIGEALKTFNFQWLRRVLSSGSVVLLISDGWDRGDPDLLARETSRLQRSCHRLIWLNPLLGSPSYQPLTRGMQAAMPYVDDFLPVHNLNSLDALARHLGSLADKRRPASPYRPTRPVDPDDQNGTVTETGDAGMLKPGAEPAFKHPKWGRRP